MARAAFRSIRLAVREKRHELAIAPSQPRRDRAVGQDDGRAHDSRGAPGRRRRKPERRPVWICRIGRRQHGHLDLIAHAGRWLTQRAKQVEGAGQRELRRAEARDEVAAPDPAAFLHRLQHRVDDAETSRRRFRHHGLACQDAVTREKLIRPRGGPGGGLRGPLGLHQRPPSFRGRRRQPPRAERGRLELALLPPWRARLCEGAQRVERVVGDRPAPHEIPERGDGVVGIAAADGLVKRAEEAGAVRPEKFDDRGFAPVVLDVRLKPDATDVAGRKQTGQMIGQIQRDASVAGAERFDAHPDDLAGRRHGVQVRGIVCVDPRGKDLGFEDRRGQRRALELLDRIEQRVRAVPAPD